VCNAQAAGAKYTLPHVFGVGVLYAWVDVCGREVYAVCVRVCMCMRVLYVCCACVCACVL